jgi:hypothetical protein
MPADASPGRGVNGTMHADPTLFGNRQPLGTVTTSPTDGIAESSKKFRSREQQRKRGGAMESVLFTDSYVFTADQQ